MLVRSLLLKSGESLAGDAFWIDSATCFGLAHDIADTDCWAQNGPTAGSRRNFILGDSNWTFFQVGCPPTYLFMTSLM